MPTPEEILTELEGLRIKRESLFARIQNVLDSSRTLTSENVRLFRPRIDKLVELEAGFEGIQDQIIDRNSQIKIAADKLEVLNVQKACDNIIYEVRGKYMDLIRSMPASSDTSSAPHTSTTSKSSLPNIAIPKFSGKIEDWNNFISLFTSIIHKNATLSSAEKFVYLRSLLHSDALAVISALEVTPENYDLAFAALQNRYQNKRRLAIHYLSQIKNFTGSSLNTRNGLQHFLNIHSNSINALRALNIPDLADFLLFQMVSENLDTNIRKAFEAKIQSNSIPTYKELIDFVTEQCKTFEVVGAAETSNTSKSRLKSLPSKRPNSFLTKTKENNSPGSSRKGLPPAPTCPLCQSSHSLSRCEEFLAQGIQQKYDTIKSLKRCFNCLGNHFLTSCASTNTCKHCNGKHHTLLHAEKDSTKEIPPNSTTVTLSCRTTNNLLPHHVLLGTVQLFIQDEAGIFWPIRAVVDPGSQISAITLRTVNRLGLRRSQAKNIEVSGISGSYTKTQGIVNCILRSKYSSESLKVNAVVLTSIANKLPTLPLPTSIRQKFMEIDLADSSFDQPSKIDFLIGADIYPHILSPHSPHIISGNPSAIRTLFGWIIMGNTSIEHPTTSSVSLLVVNPSLDSLLRQFWEQEEIEISKPVNPDDVFCEEHFLQTHSRDASGRYSVSLPFKKGCTSLGVNRHIAMKSFFNLEKRLHKQPGTEAPYQAFLTEYEDLRHMNVITKPSSYILPHHCVFKQTSSSTKIRVVFNGSALDSKGSSLNERLLPGPKLQNDLSDILISFRVHEVAICADIRMMYRQIMLVPQDRQFNHIFWRSKPNLPVQEYELNTVTYGLTSSAYLAQRVLHQLVTDEGAQYPLASNALIAHSYVDDIVTGAASMKEAEKLKTELINLLSKGGFELRKWCSNLPESLNSLPAQYLENPIVFSTEESAFKILGLMWEPNSDNFTYHTHQFQGPSTKRTILSYISQIFDPLGWLTPVVFWAKHFLQQLWLFQCDWDEPLNPILRHQWETFVAEIHLLQ
ncbi:uncharacterized protein LOC135119984 [Zophobas morio]|uniref:uncharacterized protein LOC135119984 n=1 Tax=Zophobas morio TaxID=2755281 RepID=UPI003083D9E9